MKKGQILQGTVKSVDFPNKGQVETEEGIFAVKGVLPGQTVEFRTGRNKSGKGTGTLISVLKRAENEIEPDCPHFGRCGGCALRSISYESTLELKKEQVRKLLLTPLRTLDPELEMEDAFFEGITGSPEIYGYRNKMEFTFGDEVKDGPLSLGLHKKDSFYDIVTVSGCRIVDEDIRKILQCTRDFFAPLMEKGELSFYHRMRHEGFLRHLLVRKTRGTQEILVDLVTTSDSRREEYAKEWKERLLRLELTGKFAGILTTVNDSPADAIKDEGTEILYGRNYITEHILGLTFKISVFSFFQTNTAGAEVLYETARSFLHDAGAVCRGGKMTGRIFDLYSGTGTIAQLLAPDAAEVVGVEIVEEAVEAARQNSALNKLENCRFIAGDVLKVLDEITERPDVIVLDPPRDGIHPKALPKILAYNVPDILYISCKPTSLARDLAGFYKSGYRLKRVKCVDMFPWTTGVETVALFEKTAEE